MAGVLTRRELAGLLVVAIVTAVAALSFGGGGESGDAATPKAGDRVAARIVRVVDGDTVKADIAGDEVTVRYIGVDTPESVKPNTPVQCYAKAASERNEALVGDANVNLVIGEEPHDRYGRLLAYVYLSPSGRFVNAELVRDGFARTLTIAPNDLHAAEFATLQKAAQRSGRGLWGRC